MPDDDPSAFAQVEDALFGPGGPPTPASDGTWTLIGPPPAPAAPPVLPGYVVHEELARGGMGVVYRATQTGLSRTVAVKLLLGDDPRAAVRFLAEAESLAAVRHPQVVQVFDTGRAAGRAFLAMEFCSGGTLATRLEAGPLPPLVAAALLAGLADAVQAAHAQDVVHRDLKPGNVLFDATGVAKVADFGLAKRAGGADLTRTLAMLGTPAYMAPEQARGGAKFVGPAADVWALGVILYECLTGQKAFPGHEPFAVLDLVLTTEPPRPRTRVPGLARDLELVCLTCLRKEPGERYESAAALAADLRRFLAGRPVAARPVPAAVRVWKWGRRNPSSAGLLLVALVLAVGLPAFLARTRAERERSADALRAAEALAATRAEFALLETIRRRARERSPGWADANLRDLRAAAPTLLDPAVRRAARSEAAVALLAVDGEELPAVGEQYAAGQVAAAGPLLAVGQFKAPGFVGPLAVWLLDPATGTTARTVTTWPRVLNPGAGGGVGQDGVRSLLASPDGRTLFAGTRGGWVARFALDRSADAPAKSWAVADRPVVDLAASADGRSVFAVTETNTVQAWDPTTDARTAAARLDDRPAGVAVDPVTGRVFVAARHLSARDPMTLAEVGRREFPTGVGAVRAVGGIVYAGVGAALVAVDAVTLAGNRSFRDPDLPADAHLEAVTAVAPHPTGTLVASVSEHAGDRTAKVWEAASGRLLATVPLPGAGPARAAWAADGRTLCVGVDRGVVRWRLTPPAACRATAPAPAPVRAAGFAAGGVVTVAQADPYDTPWVGRLDADRPGPPQGNWLPPRGGFQMVRPGLADDPARGRVLFARGPVLWGCDPAAGGGGVVSDARDPGAVQVAPDGRVWHLHSGNRVRVVDPATGVKAGEWDNGVYEVFTGASGLRALAAGKSWAVAAGADGGVRVLAGADAKFLRLVPPLADAGRPVPTAVALDEAAGRAVVGDQRGRVRVLDVRAGADAAPSVAAHAGAVTAVVPTAVGWVTAGRDRAVRVWAAGPGGGLVPRFEVVGLPAPVAGVQAHPDGRRLLVHLTGEHAVRVWDLGRLADELRDAGLWDEE